MSTEGIPKKKSTKSTKNPQSKKRRGKVNYQIGF